MLDMTAPRLIWQGSGSPPPGGKTGSKYRFEPCEGVCATCSHPVDAGVPVQPRRGVAGILNATFSGHAEYIAHGTHVCDGCAWLYGEPKSAHRAVLTIGDQTWWPTVSQDVAGRPKWLDVLQNLAAASPDTPMTGVLTLDPKPRLWPRALLADCGSPGLYVHWLDYDVSRWLDFEPRKMLDALSMLCDLLGRGVTKREMMLGALNSRLIDKFGMRECVRVEQELADLRGSPEFTIATAVSVKDAA